jgi:hypothetical protein
MSNCVFEKHCITAPIKQECVKFCLQKYAKSCHC